MPQFVLRHPDDPSVRVAYGVDERGDPWAEVWDGSVVVRHDAAAEDYDIGQPIVGLLVFLGQYGLFGGTDIADAREWLPNPPGCRRRRPRSGVRRVLRVVRDLENAAG